MQVEARKKKGSEVSGKRCQREITAAAQGNKKDESCGAVTGTESQSQGKSGEGGEARAEIREDVCFLTSMYPGKILLS